MSHALRILIACALALTGAHAARAEPYTIVATTTHVADLARNIAGQRAQVVSLLGEGVDPHLYRLTRSDVARLRAADVVLYNGLLLEGKMTDALTRLAETGKPVHAVAEMLDDALLLAPEEFEGAFDPHVWMDPVLWASLARPMAERLAAFDPQHADAYLDRAAAYSAQVLDLHERAAAALATIPDSARVLVTAHDAFNYFGRRYDLEVLGIQGMSTESEAGVRRIESLVRLIAERRVPAVFVETTVSDRNVRALIEGAAARDHTLRIGGRLYSDAMGAPGAYEGAYIGMLDHNVSTVVGALGGRIDEYGLLGKLGAPLKPFAGDKE